MSHFGCSLEHRAACFVEYTAGHDDVLQCVAVCCSVLHCIVECFVECTAGHDGVLQCVAVCCGVLHCVAVCCSVLQCVVVCCSVWQGVSWNTLQAMMVCSIVLE